MTLSVDHATEPIGTWGLERAALLVAKGGYFLQHDAPFADLHM